MAGAKLLILFGLVHRLFALVLHRDHSNGSIASMERFFDPSDQDRELATATIMHSMTDDDALRILENDDQASPSLIASVEFVLTSTGSAKASRGSLRSSAAQPDIGSTKKMLNDMLYKSSKKYDLEQAKCSNYYAKQCKEMEACRGEISAANGAAAACKSKMLGAQGQVDIASKELPKLTLSLSQHTANCEKEVNATKKHLSKMMGDISVMTSILKMSDCKKSLLQTQIALLKSPHAHDALQDIVNSSSAAPIIELAQDDSIADPKKKKMKIKKGKLAKKPVPRVQAPVDPCEDPYAVPAAGKRAAKCTMSGSPNCAKMQSKFLFVQAGMMDERDNLKEQLSELEDRCELNHKTLSTKVEQAESSLKDEQTKLAEASSCESSAQEKSRLVNAQNTELQEDMAKMQKTCQANFQSLMSEQCGLRKIRGEVLKLSGIDSPVGDCKLGKWEPGQCSKKCAGGTLVLTRSILMPEQGGAECLPLSQNRSCNDGPCPVDCKLGKWGSWSRCSSECGGGVAQRARDTKVHMRYGGKPCGQTSEAKACNAHACDKDCTLKKWTKWTGCSKQCDGGTKRRTRFVKEAALGEGKCEDASAKTRLQFKKCNVKPCKKLVRKGKPTLQCKSKVDVILLLDGSSDLGSKGWSKAIEAAKLFVSSFQDNEDARVAVLTFSGPDTWSGVSKCMGEAPGPVDMQKDCKISWASRFSGDVDALTSKLDALSWPKGGSLTSLALSAAENELQLARKDASSVVVVVTDGRPLSYRRTGLASERIKEKARLIWVPVSKFAPLGKFKLWASQRWQENVVQMSSYSKLATAASIDHLIANICPRVDGGVPNFREMAAMKMKKIKKMK